MEICECSNNSLRGQHCGLDKSVSRWHFIVWHIPVNQSQPQRCAILRRMWKHSSNSRCTTKEYELWATSLTSDESHVLLVFYVLHASSNVILVVHVFRVFRFLKLNARNVTLAVHLTIVSRFHTTYMLMWEYMVFQSIRLRHTWQGRTFYPTGVLHERTLSRTWRSATWYVRLGLLALESLREDCFCIQFTSPNPTAMSPRGHKSFAFLSKRNCEQFLRPQKFHIHSEHCSISKSPVEVGCRLQKICLCNVWRESSKHPDPCNCFQFIREFSLRCHFRGRCAVQTTNTCCFLCEFSSSCVLSGHNATDAPGV